MVRHMSIESAIEQKIKDAIAHGEFDDLACSGKPLDLDAYFNTPEDLRMAFAMLRSNNFVPEEVEMLKEIASLKEQIKDAEGDEKDRLTKLLHGKTLALLALILEKYSRKR